MPRIPASQRDAFYEERRSEIAAAALRLWAAGGYDQTSVAAIAGEVGVSKGTFYLYFDSKEALLEDVLRRNSLLPHVQKLVEDLRDAPLEVAVRGFVAGAWRHLCGHKDLVLVAVRELPTHVDQASALFERVLLPANFLLGEYLESRLPQGRVGRLNMVIAARSLVGMILVSFLTQEVLGASRIFPVPEDEITETLAELFLRGVAGAPEEKSRP